MDSSSFSSRKPNGLASITSEIDSPTFSGHLLSRPIFPSSPLPRRSSIRNFSQSLSFGGSSSPRSGRFFDGRYEEQQPHFLDSCFLCRKPIGDNKDIYMYRGDTPFCSEECREEQIERDEAKEKKMNLKASMKALRNREEQEKSNTTSSSNKNTHFRSGAVAAA